MGQANGEDNLRKIYFKCIDGPQALPRCPQLEADLRAVLYTVQMQGHFKLQPFGSVTGSEYTAGLIIGSPTKTGMRVTGQYEGLVKQQWTVYPPQHCSVGLLHERLREGFLQWRRRGETVSVSLAAALHTGDVVEEESTSMSTATASPSESSTEPAAANKTEPKAGELSEDDYRALAKLLTEKADAGSVVDMKTITALLVETTRLTPRECVGHRTRLIRLGLLIKQEPGRYQVDPGGTAPPAAVSRKKPKAPAEPLPAVTSSTVTELEATLASVDQIRSRLTEIVQTIAAKDDLIRAAEAERTQLREEEARLKAKLTALPDLEPARVHLAALKEILQKLPK